MNEIAKKWGKEVIIHNSNSHCCKILTVEGNRFKSSLHYHRQKTETFVVISGILYLEYIANEDFSDVLSKVTDLNDFSLRKYMKFRKLRSGEDMTIMTYSPHRFWTEERKKAIFVEASSQDFIEDSVRLIESHECFI
jgi:D-lyxose ketol-isomerase